MSRFRTLIQRVQHSDNAAYAAALAYNFLFALFPLLLFLTALLGLLHLPSVKNYLSGPVSVLIAPALRRLIVTAISQASRYRSPTLLSVGALGFVWLTSGALRQLSNALNHAYRIDHPHRSWWRKIALSLGLGVLVGSLMVASVAIGTWGRDIIGWLFLTVLHRAAGPALADVIRWVMLLALMWVVLSLIYNWLPDRVQSFRWNLPGTYAVMMLWVIISLGFSVYASHFNHYNRTYGSLGVVILLMLYLYVLSFALLIGGEINALFATEDGSPP